MKPSRSIRRTAAIVAVAILTGCHLTGTSFAADQSVSPAGLVLLLPGVTNLEGELAGLGDLIAEAHPDWEIKNRTWGPPLLSLYNLAAYERNLETARRRAQELAAYRRAHPDARITVVGYSGGGGIAVLIAAALPEGVQIDRLILIAPAIAPDYPLAERVLPHVREFVVNYASKRDLQVGWGTDTFGTIDRAATPSAGYEGFKVSEGDQLADRLVQVYWEPAMQNTGHLGNHLGYLSPDWQKRYLVPVLDPKRDAQGVRDCVRAAIEM